MNAEPFSHAVAQGVREADPDALAAVWQALSPGLLRWLLAQVRDAGVAEDLLQETFLELWRSCRGIDGGPRQIRAWLYRAAGRNLLDWRRTRRRRPEQVVERLPDRAGPDDPFESAAGADEAARLQTGLRALPGSQGVVLALRFRDDLSASEVAQALGTTEGAVRSLQHRGLGALRAALPRTGISAAGRAGDAAGLGAGRG